MRREVAVVAAIVLLAPGCAGVGDAESAATPSSARTAYRETGVTCGEWLSADGQVRASIESGIRGSHEWTSLEGTSAYGAEASLVIQTSGSPSVRLPDGSLITGFDDFFEWVCADATAETTLQEARLARFGSDVDPTCGDFLQQPADVQEMWLEVASTASGSAIAEEDLSSVCGDSPDSSFRATAEGLQWILEDLERRALEASRVSFTWETEDHLGYTLSHTVTVGQVQRGDAPHYNDSNFLIGSTCDFDPSTDALVPVVFAVTNTTTGYDQLIDVSYAVQSWGGITTVTPRVAGRFSGGNECIGGYAYTGSGSTIVRITWQNPVAPGQTARSNQFIVLQDYYSPSHPGGNTADLSQIFVSSGFSFLGVHDDGVLLDGTEIEGTR